jgi:glycosyltransferase involved in cell wall biosynthesis
MDALDDFGFTGRDSHFAIRGSRPHISLSAHLLSLSPDYRGAGINRYIYGLLTNLPVVNGHSRYTAYLGDGRMRAVSPPSLDLCISRLPTVRPVVRIAWEQFVQPWVLARDRVDLVHALAYALPLACPARSLVTIHDLSFLLFPDAFDAANRLYLTAATRLAARQADAVIVVSENTRRDVIRLLGVPAGRVLVVLNGVDPTFKPIADADAVARFRRERGLPDRFILFVGTLEPRKNLVRLVEAFHRRPIRSNPVRLVLAGGVGWRYAGLLRRVEELGLRDRVLFPGFVPYDQLPWWYNAAELFVFPSRYEGFGLPPLEAMACGTPVIASTASSLPEVVGDAGLLVEPDDVDGLAEAMARLLGDADLRAELRTRGLARAATYSWRRTAAETARVYWTVLGTTPPGAVPERACAADNTGGVTPPVRPEDAPGQPGGQS